MKALHYFQKLKIAIQEKKLFNCKNLIFFNEQKLTLGGPCFFNLFFFSVQCSTLTAIFYFQTLHYETHEKNFSSVSFWLFNEQKLTLWSSMSLKHVFFVFNSTLKAMLYFQKRKKATHEKKFFKCIKWIRQLKSKAFDLTLIPGLTTNGAGIKYNTLKNLTTTTPNENW